MSRLDLDEHLSLRQVTHRVQKCAEGRIHTISHFEARPRRQADETPGTAFSHSRSGFAIGLPFCGERAGRHNDRLCHPPHPIIPIH
jgi:hypothetical protein